MTNMTLPDITTRERNQLISSLAAGVLPRAGYPHIQVGRNAEARAIYRDLERALDGGSFVRFVLGEYGAGKSFFLSLSAAMAHEHKMVTACADLDTVKRLHATDGQARLLYAELMTNLATRARPEGGALPAIVERFVSNARQEADANCRDVATVIQAKLERLQDMTGGYDFATVVGTYWRGYDSGNEQLKADAIRWLRAEYTTKTEAREALGVRTIIDDANMFDALKLMAAFVRLAGFSGLLVCLDECGNINRLTQPRTRSANHEQILRIVNDLLQGGTPGLGVIFAGTPEFLHDARRGLYSHDALRSRLSVNPYAKDGLIDLHGPVMRLANLTAEDLYVLLTKLRHVHATGDPTRYLISDQGIEAFMAHLHGRLGDATFRTPRETIRAFLGLLAVLEQNPDAELTTLLGTLSAASVTNASRDPDATDSDVSNELVELQL